MSAEPLTSGPGSAGDETSTPSRPELSVLLIEDNADDALLLERHLRRAGFAPRLTRIETAEAMAAALEDAPSRWDIILADYNLPRFSAPEALRLLKDTHQDIPFIMMSGVVSEATAVAAMGAGAHDYVSKENLTRLGPAIERELAEAASRRKKRAAERALQQSEERFHRLVEATPLPLFISDMAGRIVYVNHALEQLLGIGREGADTGTLHIRQILPPLDPRDIDGSEAAIPSLLEMSLKEPGQTFETTCVDGSGRRLPVLLGAAILNPEAGADDRQLAAFLVDLTQQKRGEEVLRRTEKLAATGRLAASIAHEINNPLEAITNCLYLLALDPLPETARGYLKLAQQELDRVTHITTQTLRFYRQSTRAAAVSLRDLLESVLALYEARLRNHDVRIHRDFRPVPPVIAFDGEMRQVLANLVGNALDAMSFAEEGAAAKALTLRLRRTLHSKTGVPSVAILVADNGTGMSAETLRRMYEPFFSTKGITGTGLGLWVSLGILHKHHAEVRVRSRQGAGSGTVFRIVLPVDGIPEEGQAEEHPLLGMTS